MRYDKIFVARTMHIDLVSSRIVTNCQINCRIFNYSGFTFNSHQLRSFDSVAFKS